MRYIDFDTVFDLDNLLKDFVKVLKSGAKLFLPSDAGYVVLVLEDSVDQVNKIRQNLKTQEPVTYLFSSKFNILEKVCVDDVSTQLVEEYLPASLILEIEGAGKNEGSFIRVRYPDHNLLNLLAAQLDNILVFELNVKGENIPYSIEQLNDSFCLLFEDNDLAVNAGLLNLNDLPAIVRVVDNQVQILRPNKVISTLLMQFSVRTD
jgi:tRNA A37 threonylcarbamoyladenosine synthetase subunit TsaC/SUA5/YrdC